MIRDRSSTSGRISWNCDGGWGTLRHQARRCGKAPRRGAGLAHRAEEAAAERGAEKEPREKKAVQSRMREAEGCTVKKNVIECNCVTGDYSMLLEVLFENTMELDRFIGELQYFGRTKTLIVFSTSVEHRGVEL